MNICILNFSGRENGNCKRISDFVAENFNGEKIIQYNFGQMNLTACGKCNYECFKSRKDCPYFSDGIYEIYDCITNADLAFFIIPNYCDYPCANYFIFNERSQCYFQGREDLLNKYLQVKKKFIVTSNTNRANFLKVFEYQREESVEPEILFLSAKSYGKNSLDGNITDSKKAVSDIGKFIKEERDSAL